MIWLISGHVGTMVAINNIKSKKTTRIAEDRGCAEKELYGNNARMRVGPQEQFDIIVNTFNFGVK
jgi:hypothetical protein